MKKKKWILTGMWWWLDRIPRTGGSALFHIAQPEHGL